MVQFGATPGCSRQDLRFRLTKCFGDPTNNARSLIDRNDLQPHRPYFTSNFVFYTLLSTTSGWLVILYTL